jgi:3-hydroxy-9,10-secoandrosta-1,3,5(10)-triene-9,17-dione monooxygenase reductase component
MSTLKPPNGAAGRDEDRIATGPEPGMMRSVLSRVPTCVAVVTGLDSQRRPVGLAIGSFTSVSLEPPLVAFYVARTSTTWPRIVDSSFCVNVLGDQQQPISHRFAISGGDKFASVGWRPSPVTGAPRLDDVHVCIECKRERQLEVGDHCLVVGRVVSLEACDDVQPMLFYRGGYHGVAAIPLLLSPASPGADGE